MLEANKASASFCSYDPYQTQRITTQWHARIDKMLLHSTIKALLNSKQWQRWVMKQDAQSTRNNKTASIVTCNSQYYTNIDQANAKEARGYDFQTQQDLRNFEQQKELAKMGYNNQYNLANLNYNQDIKSFVWLMICRQTKTCILDVMDMRQQDTAIKIYRIHIWWWHSTKQCCRLYKRERMI